MDHILLVQVTWKHEVVRCNLCSAVRNIQRVVLPVLNSWPYIISNPTLMITSCVQKQPERPYRGGVLRGFIKSSNCSKTIIKIFCNDIIHDNELKEKLWWVKLNNLTTQIVKSATSYCTTFKTVTLLYVYISVVCPLFTNSACHLYHHILLVIEYLIKINLKRGHPPDRCTTLVIDWLSK